MAAFADISLLDKDSVAKVFSPQSINSDGTAIWRKHTTYGLDTHKVATLRVSLPKSGNNVSRIKGTLKLPVTDVDNAKLGEINAYIDVVIPSIAEEIDRQNAQAFLASFISNAVFAAAVENMESVY